MSQNQPQPQYQKNLESLLNEMLNNIEQLREKIYPPQKSEAFKSSLIDLAEELISSLQDDKFERGLSILEMRRKVNLHGGKLTEFRAKIDRLTREQDQAYQDWYETQEELDRIKQFENMPKAELISHFRSIILTALTHKVIEQKDFNGYSAELREWESEAAR